MLDDPSLWHCHQGGPGVTAVSRSHRRQGHPNCRLKPLHFCLDVARTSEHGLSGLRPGILYPRSAPRSAAWPGPVGDHKVDVATTLDSSSAVNSRRRRLNS